MVTDVSTKQEPDCESSCSPAYQSVLGDTSVVTGDQFVLEPLPERLFSASAGCSASVPPVAQLFVS